MTELEEKQANCPYCHERQQKLSGFRFDGLSNGQLDYDLARNFIEFRYCPICGRKLGEDE